MSPIFSSLSETSRPVATCPPAAKMRWLFGFALATSVLLSGIAAHAQTVSGITVLGSANPFLAGMPDGSTASGDSAPDQSPALVSGLNLTDGGFLTFLVNGSIDYGGGSPTDTPDGQTPEEGFFATGHGAENGMGGYTTPANALVGVFLSSAQPDLTAAPADLDFTSGSPDALGIGFSALSPQLKQVFFIGDGLTGTGTGTAQQFNIPTGATRLYLGTVDGSGWFNNSGSFTVSATRSGGTSTAAPEPTSCALALFGTLPLASKLLRRRRRVSA